MSSPAFNPGFLADDALIRGFVVRQSELATIVRIVEGNTGPSLQHLLVIGGRGSGKSTLVRRVVAEVRRRPDLDARWYPVVFPEEAYEIGDIGEFWLEALLHLGDQTGDRRWIELHGRLRSERDPSRLERAARGALEAHAQELGRRILLVVENLDMLMGRLSEPDAWVLRKALQDAPTFMLLATAVRKFEALGDHSAAFYESLRQMELRPLTASEIEDVWASVAGHRTGYSRAQAIRVLTGGNPRMVVLLARLVDGRSLRGILDELSGLIDLHTDYFKGNIEALDGQNQRVFLALANLWRPATAGVVAEEARLDSNTASTVLARLERQGRVAVVGKKGKNKLYQVAERLHNIYYLMRRRGGVDARLKALIEFMTLFYEPAETESPPGRPVNRTKASDAVEEADEAMLFASTQHEGLLGHPDRALALFARLVPRSDARPGLVPLALSLAAAGQTPGVVAALAHAPDPEVFRPLVIALGGTVEPAPSAEETALAADVSERLDGLRQRTAAK